MPLKAFITRVNIVSDRNPAIMRDMLPYAEHYIPELGTGDTYDDPAEAVTFLEIHSPFYTDYVLVYQAHVDNTVEIIRHEIRRPVTQS